MWTYCTAQGTLYSQNSLTVYMGKKSKKRMNLHTCITDSLCRTPEANTL